MFPADDDTFSGERLDEEARWSVYVTSYQMLDPTEGVPHSKVGKSFLKRNLGKDADVNKILSDDRQEVRIDVSTYRIVFIYNGMTGKPFVYLTTTTPDEQVKIDEKMKAATKERTEKMQEKFVTNTSWMKSESKEAVERTTAAWQKGLKEGLWKMDEFLKQSPNL